MNTYEMEFKWSLFLHIMESVSFLLNCKLFQKLEKYKDTNLMSLYQVIQFVTHFIFLVSCVLYFLIGEIILWHVLIDLYIPTEVDLQTGLGMSTQNV